jgi:hypothetical protein
MNHPVKKSNRKTKKRGGMRRSGMDPQFTEKRKTLERSLSAKQANLLQLERGPGFVGIFPGIAKEHSDKTKMAKQAYNQAETETSNARAVELLSGMPNELKISVMESLPLPQQVEAYFDENILLQMRAMCKNFDIVIGLILENNMEKTVSFLMEEDIPIDETIMNLEDKDEKMLSLRRLLYKCVDKFFLQLKILITRKDETKMEPIFSDELYGELAKNLRNRILPLDIDPGRLSLFLLTIRWWKYLTAAKEKDGLTPVDSSIKIPVVVQNTKKVSMNHLLNNNLWLGWLFCISKHRLNKKH